MQLLNKNNFAVSFAAAKEQSRYTMHAILVTDQETVATDGHILARVSLPTEAKKQDFPNPPGFTPNGFTKALVPVLTCKDIEKAIPKKPNFPILQHAAITTSEKNVQVAVNDLESPRVFTVKPPEGQFPNWDSSALWDHSKPAEPARNGLPAQPAKDGKPVIDIAFDANLLKRVLDAAVKFSNGDRIKPVRLRFYGNNDSMRFDMVNDDGQELNGLVMPVRSDVKPQFKPE